MLNWITNLFSKPNDTKYQESEASQETRNPNRVQTVETQQGENIEEAIRLEAYYLWEADGKPEGQMDYYWQKASEIVNQQKRAFKQ